MRKLLIFFVVTAVALTVTSCGDGTKQEEDNGDSVAVADSLAEIARRDSAEWAGFTSKDLTFFGLHGHVKAMLTGGTVFEFDTLGNWTKIGNVSPYGRKVTFDDYYSVFNRDANGYVAKEEFWEGGTEYVWKDGRIVGENSFNCAYESRLAYEYDSLGNVVAATMVESDDAGESWSKPTKIKYTYVRFDRTKNWTMRKSSNGTEERFFVYYENPKYVVPTSDFAPWQNGYMFVGTIGKEKNCPLSISPQGGGYTVQSGSRHTELAEFDAKSGSLTVRALASDDERRLGEFVGTVSKAGKGKFRYNGTFTNKKGGKLAFDFVSL